MSVPNIDLLKTVNWMFNQKLKPVVSIDLIRHGQMPVPIMRTEDGDIQAIIDTLATSAGYFWEGGRFFPPQPDTGLCYNNSNVANEVFICNGLTPISEDGFTQYDNDGIMVNPDTITEFKIRTFIIEDGSVKFLTFDEFMARGAMCAGIHLKLEPLGESVAPTRYLISNTNQENAGATLKFLEGATFDNQGADGTTTFDPDSKTATICLMAITLPPPFAPTVSVAGPITIEGQVAIGIGDEIIPYIFTEKTLPQYFKPNNPHGIIVLSGEAPNEFTIENERSTNVAFRIIRVDKATAISSPIGSRIYSVDDYDVEWLSRLKAGTREVISCDGAVPTFQAKSSLATNVIELSVDGGGLLTPEQLPVWGTCPNG